MGELNVDAVADLAITQLKERIRELQAERDAARELVFEWAHRAGAAGARANRSYRDGWADGERWVLDHWRDYAIRRTAAGRAWIRARRAAQRRLGTGMYAHPVAELGGQEANDA